METAGLWRRLILRLALWGLGIWFVWKVLPGVVGLLWPVLGALALAAALERPVGFFHRKFRLRRGWSAAALVLGAVGLVVALTAALVWLVAGQARALLDDWPRLWSSLAGGVEQMGRSVEAMMPGQTGLWQQLGTWLSEALAGALSALVSLAGRWAVALPGALVGLAVLLLAACAISADYPRVRAGLVAWVPAECRDFLAGVKRIAAAAFGGCLKAELLLSALVFAVLLVGFLVTDEPYGALLALALAVVDFVPVLGAGTVLAPWAVVEVLRGNWPHAMVLAVLWGATALVRRLAEGHVVGGQTGLSPAASLVSIYVGMRLFGVAGLLLGPVGWVILIAIYRAGALDATVRDLRLAVGSVTRALKR